MTKKKWCIIFQLLFYKSTILFAQSQNYFSSPLDIPLKLSGNFGEIRSNHFHSGLDFKTDGAEGKNVYAVADGYVSRIKVSATGYGNALYITHPGGYVSLYGHLQRYTDTISNYVFYQQLERQSFEIEVFPDSNMFHFKKGDLIAISGNSGGSAGPHLHFELRDRVTEKIINPMIFGYAINDTIPPLLNSLGLFEHKILTGIDSLFDTTAVNYDEKQNVFIVRLNINDTIITTTDAQFGFEADDYADEGLNKLGIYKVTLMVDDSLIWNYQFETFAFDETRSVNAHIDYAEWVLNKKIFQRCYRLPGDSFSVYLSNSTASTPVYEMNKLHRAQLQLKDYKGNMTILNFHFESVLKKAPWKNKHKSINKLSFNKPYLLKTKHFSLQFTDKALFDDLELFYHTERKKPGFNSPIIVINDHTVPLRNPATLSIKADLKTKAERDKAIVVMLDKDKAITYAGGRYNNGAMVTQIRTLGSYAIAVDSIPPVISFQNKTDTFSHGDVVAFYIHDALSGIATYKVNIDSRLIIPVYDAKSNMMFVPVNRLDEGEQLIKVVVSDVKGNISELITKVYIKPS